MKISLEELKKDKEFIAKAEFLSKFFPEWDRGTDEWLRVTLALDFYETFQQLGQRPSPKRAAKERKPPNRKPGYTIENRSDHGYSDKLGLWEPPAHIHLKDSWEKVTASPIKSKYLTEIEKFLKEPRSITDVSKKFRLSGSEVNVVLAAGIHAGWTIEAVAPPKTGRKGRGPSRLLRIA